MCRRACTGRSKRGVGMNRSPGLWVLAFVCLGLVLASSMMNATDPRPVASDPTAPPWSVLGDLSYSTQAGSEPSWCKFVNWSLKKPAQFPFELLSGNHESSGPVLIDK